VKGHNARALLDPEQPVWVEPIIAARMTCTSVNTIRSWVRRGTLTAACDIRTRALHVDARGVVTRRDTAA